MIVLLLAGCSERENHAVAAPILVGKFHLRGECREDHASSSAKYVGSVVWWRASEQGSDSVYGSVHTPLPDPVDFAAALPGRGEYEPPFTVELESLAPETVLGGAFEAIGLSEHLSIDAEAPGPRYAATCQLEVVEREITEDGARIVAEYES